jgi:3'(2'), 5'-bisphosphate nucleotidase
MHPLTLPLYQLCDAAGERLRALYVQNLRHPLPVGLKEDSSPVTEADRVSNDLLQEGLGRIYPGGPILSEETNIPEFEKRSQWSQYWLVDPLDGTREFLEGSGHFCISIARVESSRAVLGVIYLPLTGQMYIGGVDQPPMLYTPKLQRILVPGSAKFDAPVKVLTSRRGAEDPRIDKFKRQLQRHFPWMLAEQRGSAWKFCRIVEGAGHIYPRFGATSEWDTAAGQALLEAVGGTIIDMTGRRLVYNRRPQLLNPPFFALGPAHFDWLDVLPRNSELKDNS